MMTTETIAEAIFYADFTDQMYRDALDDLIIALDEKERAEQRRLTAIEDKLTTTMLNHWQRFYDNHPLSSSASSKIEHNTRLTPTKLHDAA
jgi:hypothetical protein